MAEIKVIHMGRMAGKTTKLMMNLAEAGGGVFLTRHPLQALAIAKQHKLEGITIFPVESGLNVGMDDIEDFGDVIVTVNEPIELNFIKKPAPYPNPFIPPNMEIPC